MVNLCDRCERVFEAASKAFAVPGVAKCCYWEFGPYQALQENAEGRRCQLCCILFSLRRQYAVDHFIQNQRQDQLYFTFELSDEDSDLLFIDLFHPNQGDARLFSSRVRVRKSASNNRGTYATETSTWSWWSAQLVQDWLSTCSSDHVECRHVSAAQRLPLRFLDVDPADEMQRVRSQPGESGDVGRLSLENMPKVKICSTAGLPLDTQYLTLSHCWGRSPVAKLSHQNLAEYSQSIPSEIFRQPTAATFRQAIHVARCLGFRYLWIDALCINQEDAIEINSEIMYMNEIYSHATMNLSATAAQDGSGGLFFERDPWIAGACHSERHPSLVAFAPPEVSFVREMLGSPINQRAWVFQERMLATRVLHFCRTRLLWECFSLQEAEPLFDDKPARLLTAPGQTKSQVLSHRGEGRLLAGTARLRWANIIARYSTTSLTFRQDTLPALSAISTVVCEQRGLEPQDYAAGLWIPDLPLALRWRVARRPDGIPAEYVAPSWSWAALFCDVDVQSDLYVRVFVDKFALRVKLKTANPFGGVQDGWLRLRGQLILLRYLVSEDCFRIGRCDGQAPTVISSGFPGTIRDGLPDKVYKRSQQGLGSRIVGKSTQSHEPPLDESDVLICEWDHGIPGHGIPGHGQSGQKLRFAVSDGRFLEVPTDSFCLLPLGQRERAPEEGDEGEEESESDDKRGAFDRIEGLILHRSSGKGEYVRVGLFYYTLPDTVREGGNVLDVAFGKGESLEHDAFLERHGHDGDYSYTIRIIYFEDVEISRLSYSYKIQLQHRTYTAKLPIYSQLEGRGVTSRSGSRRKWRCTLHTWMKATFCYYKTSRIARKRMAVATFYQYTYQDHF